MKKRRIRWSERGGGVVKQKEEDKEEANRIRSG
jgi:hypothetical protein